MVFKIRLKFFIFFVLSLCLWQAQSYAQEIHGQRLIFLKGEIFYKAPITKSEAQKLGDYLKDTGYFDNNSARTVQLTKENNHYIIRMVVVPQAYQSPKAEVLFQEVLKEFSQKVFPSAKIQLHLSDNNLKTQKVIHKS